MFAGVKGFFKSVSAVATDAYFNLVTLLLPGNGTNGAQNNTFLDSSSNNFTITRNGGNPGMTQGTFSPFSQTGWSNFFDGTGDYFTWSGSAIGASQFSFECWFYHTGSFGSIQALLGPNSTTNGGISIRIASSTQIKIDRYGVGESVFTVPTLSANTWYHLVACRGASNTTTVFLNGTRSSTGTITDSYSYGNAASISYLNSASSLEFTGYLSNVRLVVGSSAYDPTQSSITVPTSPLTAITDTKLLTCQSNRFVDNSSNAFAITVNGTPSVQAFSPFAPTAAYSAATNGGSGYFDGSGDYLSVASNAAFSFGTGDFQIEFFVYAQATGLQRLVFFTVTDVNQVSIGVFNNYEITYFDGTNTRTIGTVSPNTWNHVAVAKSSGTVTCWLNGTRTVNALTDNSNSSSNRAVALGASDTGTNPFNGYISSLRIIKGSTTYSGATITVPTAPVTAITNTQLLTNFTNAGITDATAKNDLETVGNAQISTTQSKFGGSSMYFDGTGDYLISPQSTLMDLQGDFTVEMWVYFNSVADTSFVGKWGGVNLYAWLFQYISGTGLRFFPASSGTLGTAISGSWSPSTGVWYHIAATRSSGNIRLFVDGSQVGTTTANTDNCSVSNQPLNIGRNQDGNIQYLNGYIDDLRITKGYARYTANFTPPTAAFPLS